MSLEFRGWTTAVGSVLLTPKGALGTGALLVEPREEEDPEVLRLDALGWRTVDGETRVGPWRVVLNGEVSELGEVAVTGDWTPLCHGAEVRLTAS
jgi:hypothetical protein